MSEIKSTEQVASKECKTAGGKTSYDDFAYNNIVKWSCGCIGLDVVVFSFPEEKIPLRIILEDCRTDRADPPGVEYVPHINDMSGKSKHLISQQEIVDLFENLGDLAADGIKFRQLKDLLGS